MIDDATKSMILMSVFNKVFNHEKVLNSSTPRHQMEASLHFIGGIAQGLIVTLEEKLHGSCEWKPDETDGSWNGRCGSKWVFTAAGGPSAHGMSFCPSCGRAVKEV